MSWSKATALALIRDVAMVPVVRVASTEQAFTAVEGVVGADIAIVEITLTIPNALRVVEDVSARYGEKVLVGAGTVLDAETGRAALLAGAEFLVSPALNLQVIELARRYGKVCVPGAMTPTEVLTAWQAGADLVKIFPSGLLGGPKYLRALKGPFPDIEFLVTGGVNFETAPEYIRAGATAVGVGECILNPEALRQADVAAITANGRRFVEAVRSGKAATGKN